MEIEEINEIESDEMDVIIRDVCDIDDQGRLYCGWKEKTEKQRIVIENRSNEGNACQE